MRLEKRTIENMQDFVHENLSGTDAMFVEDLAMIIDKDLIFQDRPSKIRPTLEKINLKINRKTYTVSYNMAYLKKMCHQRYFQANPEKLPEDILYKYWVSFGVCHEFSHKYQFLCRDYEISEWAEVNDCYQSFDRARNNGQFNLMHYRKHHKEYFFERNADIIASKIMMSIFPEEEMHEHIDLIHLNAILDGGYAKEDGKIISPVERTYGFLEQDFNLPTNDLPFEVRFEQGFPITEEEYGEIYQWVNEKEKRAKYGEINKAIKKLTIGRR